jgi:transposase-like protein
MAFRKWDPKTKAMVVMAGIKGRSVVEICNEYQIPQSMYYRWRDQFLGNMPRLFSDDTSNREKELQKENPIWVFSLRGTSTTVLSQNVALNRG